MNYKIWLDSFLLSWRDLSLLSLFSSRYVLLYSEFEEWSFLLIVYKIWSDSFLLSLGLCPSIYPLLLMFLDALIPNVMKPAHKKIEMIDECLRNKPLQGGNILYITKWTILGWYKWQDLLSIYRSLRGHNIIRADITIIM